MKKDMIVPWRAQFAAKSNATHVQVLPTHSTTNFQDKLLSTTLNEDNINSTNHFFRSQPPENKQAANSSRDDFRLFLNSKWFVLFWWMVCIFRICEIAFLVAMVWLYYWLLNNPVQQVDSINDLTFDFSYSTLGVMNWTFAALAMLQLFMLLQSLVFTFQAGELTFIESRAPRRPLQSFHESFWYGRAWRFVKTNWIDPVFYIHGKHFDRYFLLREYLEIASQLYQGYQMSVYIPTRHINDLFVSMVFLNCISTPVIHWLVPQANMPLRRLLSVICSAFLNFVNSVIIPFIIFIPYPSKYSTFWSAFEVQYLYDDVWYARAIRENQQLFVTSYVDYCATWMPHWSQFSCLVACGDLVRRRHRRRINHQNAHAELVPTGKKVASSPVPGRSTPRGNARSSFSKTRERLAYHGLWIIGVIVLAIHIAAQMPTNTPGCALSATPWFVTESSCVVMKVNCYRLGIEGNQQEIHGILSQISPQSLFQVIFIHCPRLQMPPVLGVFHQLTGLDIYNCTLDAWPVESALCEANHPNMIYLAGYYVNMSGLPAGLLQDFPTHLHAMYLYETNLTSLPELLHEKWPMVADHFIDFAHFDRFPSTLAQLQNLNQLSLVRNRIDSISDSDAFRLFSNSNLQYLRLSNSTLHTLPREFNGSLDHFIEVNLEYTQLREIPEYIRQWFGHKLATNDVVYHSLYGSPYCHLSGPEEDEQQRLYRSQACQEDRGTADPPAYFYVVQQQRLL